MVLDHLFQIEFVAIKLRLTLGLPKMIGIAQNWRWLVLFIPGFTSFTILTRCFISRLRQLKLYTDLLFNIQLANWSFKGLRLPTFILFHFYLMLSPLSWWSPATILCCFYILSIQPFHPVKSVEFPCLPQLLVDSKWRGTEHGLVLSMWYPTCLVIITCLLCDLFLTIFTWMVNAWRPHLLVMVQYKPTVQESVFDHCRYL